MPLPVEAAAPGVSRSFGLRNAGIRGVGAYLPQRILSNADLEEMVDTSDDWIVARSGIRERRLADAGQATSDLALEAARGALESAGARPEQVELIIVGTSSPDMIFPSTACLLQNKLGVGRAAAFDVQAACTGFIYALTLASQLVQSGNYENALVVGADALTKHVDWADRRTCVLFGDGAGAVFLGSADPGWGVLSSYLTADGSGWDMLKIPAGGTALPATRETVDERLHTVQMKGREVFKFAARAIPEVCRRLLEGTGLTLGDVKYVIPHQANQRIIDAARERLGLPEDRFPGNLEHFGNTSTASIPLVLEELNREGKLARGDLLMFVGFGAGLTWGGNLIRWEGAGG